MNLYILDICRQVSRSHRRTIHYIIITLSLWYFMSLYHASYVLLFGTPIQKTSIFYLHKRFKNCRKIHLYAILCWWIISFIMIDATLALILGPKCVHSFKQKRSNFSYQNTSFWNVPFEDIYICPDPLLLNVTGHKITTVSASISTTL